MKGKNSEAVLHWTSITTVADRYAISFEGLLHCGCIERLTVLAGIGIPGPSLKILGNHPLHIPIEHGCNAAKAKAVSSQRSTRSSQPYTLLFLSASFGASRVTVPVLTHPNCDSHCSVVLTRISPLVDLQPDRPPSPFWRSDKFLSPSHTSGALHSQAYPTSPGSYI